MTKFVYCVYHKDDDDWAGIPITYDTEAEAMESAREEAAKGFSVYVSKEEIREGEEWDDPVEEFTDFEPVILWDSDEAGVTVAEPEEKEVVSDNEFETNFPESDVKDFSDSDDESFGEQAWGSLDTSIKEAVDALEENEDEVECKVCFELGPKAEMKRLDIGYVCPKCAQELQSHQGTSLDLIDKDPFSLDYEDPRDFDEPEEEEVKEEPVDANEVRKHEAGIEENLEEHINDRPADIESDQVLQGADNAVVDCEVAKVIAHSEDEKPLDCKMEKPALEEPLAGEKVDVKINEDLSEEEVKELDKEVETLKEELKVIIDFSEYKPWSGAVDTYELIKDADKLDDLEAYLEDCYPDGITATQINDILWFDGDQVLSYLGLGDVEDEEVDESLVEAKKDDELPVDPEAAKLEVHTMLNDLVADEIEAINGYEDAKKEILDTPIAHKDNILDTIDHVEDEEKEHVDELIDATTEIPFDKEEAPAPVVEEPAQEPEQEPIPEEPVVEEGLKEAAKEIYRVDVSWSGVFCGEKRNYNNDITYIFDHEPTEQEIIDRFENDENIVRLKNWNKNNIRPAVNDFMDGVYDNDDGWKDIQITDYKISKETAIEEPLNQDFPKVEEKLEERVDLPAFDSDVKVGDKIKIIHLEGENSDYDGKEGTVDHIDSLGQLHGTWGRLAIIPGVDEFEVINEECLKEELKIIRDWISFEPSKQAEKVYNKIANAHKLDEAEAYIESKLGSEVDWDAVDWFLRTKKDGGHAEELLAAIGLDTKDIQYDPHAGKTLKKFAIYDDGNYVGDIEACDEEDAVNQCYNGAFGRSSSDNLFTAELAENLKEAKAKPEADKEKTYNDGLKLAKLHNKPVIYGYTNKSYGGKFFALDDPIVCNSVSDETKKFKQQYKSCGTVYVAYPDKDFVESLKLSESLDFEDDNSEIFTPEEQEEYNCDEDGNCLDSYDRLHHCGWCGDVFTEYEMRREADFGWLCDRCINELKSHGGPLTFIENEALKEEDQKDKDVDKDIADVMNTWSLDDEPKEQPATEAPVEEPKEEEQPAESETEETKSAEDIIKNW